MRPPPEFKSLPLSCSFVCLVSFCFVFCSFSGPGRFLRLQWTRVEIEVRVTAQVRIKVYPGGLREALARISGSGTLDTESGNQDNLPVPSTRNLRPSPTDGGAGGFPKVDFLREFRPGKKMASVSSGLPRLHPSREASNDETRDEVAGSRFPEAPGDDNASDRETRAFAPPAPVLLAPALQGGERGERPWRTALARGSRRTPRGGPRARRAHGRPGCAVVSQPTPMPAPLFAG